MRYLKKLWSNKMMRLMLIIVSALLLLILIVSISFSGNSKNVTEDSIVSAAKSYLSNNTNLLPQTNYSSRTVSLSTLIANGYIDSDANGASCSSYVTVVKYGENYFYTPYIKCNNSNDSTILSTKILSSVTESGDGLYYYNNAYIYRGENPNNYILLNGVLWRILGLDESNNIKLIISVVNSEFSEWDDRYNSNIDKNNGINDYSLSRIKEYLDSFLDDFTNSDNESIPDAIKAKLTTFTQCIDKVDIDSTNNSKCSSVLENQITGTVTVYDYINSSLDGSCSLNTSINCQNYNFLNKTMWTATAYNGEDTSKTYYINKYYGIKLGDAYVRKAVYPTIMLRSDVIYSSGSGTKSDPYIIK